MRQTSWERSEKCCVSGNCNENKQNCEIFYLNNDDIQSTAFTSIWFFSTHLIYYNKLIMLKNCVWSEITPSLRIQCYCGNFPSVSVKQACPLNRAHVVYSVTGQTHLWEATTRSQQPWLHLCSKYNKMAIVFISPTHQSPALIQYFLQVLIMRVMWILEEQRI